MPAVRLSRRRRSSLSLNALNQVKAGYYGVQQQPSPRQVTFAPNVTPVTFVDPDPSAASSDPASPTSKLFPPSDGPAPLPSRRRVPPGKRRSLGYIPRPPNAFMLFRADFVRQKHVPGSIETNHGSLSKIIGNCWRALPLEEKRVWEVKAKHAKAEHKVRHPEYRFRPVHNKNKEKKKKAAVTAEDERRCEEVAQLLLEGKKGDELAAAVRDLDRMRSDTPGSSQSPEPSPAPFSSSLLAVPSAASFYGHRRSSSVPLPNDFHPIALPSIPFLSPNGGDFIGQRFGSMSRASRMWWGQRRASSAQPIGAAVPMRSWTMPLPLPAVLQRDDSPLPEANTSLFDPMFLASSSMGFLPAQDPSFQQFNDFLSSLPPHARPGHDLDLSQTISPLESSHHITADPMGKFSMNPFAQAPYQQPFQQHQDMHASSLEDALGGWLPSPHAPTTPSTAGLSGTMSMGGMSMGGGGGVDAPTQRQPHSDPSSIYSGSPTLSDELALPNSAGARVQVHAPTPQHVYGGAAEMWKDLQQQQQQQHSHSHPHGRGQHQGDVYACGDELALGSEMGYAPAGATGMQQGHHTGQMLVPLFDPAYPMHSTTTSIGFALDEIVHDSF